MVEFRERLYKLRKDRGWSQEELAEQLGVSRQSVSKWELGNGMPSLEAVQELARIFAISIDELLYGPGEQQPNGMHEVPEPAAPPTQPEVVPAKTSRYLKIIQVALEAIFLVAALAVIAFYFRIGPFAGPQYGKIDVMKQFVDEQLNEQIPYSTMDLSMFDADSVRLRLEEAGVTSEFSDDYLNEAIQLSLTEYFSQFSEYGLSYDQQQQKLYHQNEPVMIFEDSSLDKFLLKKSWSGEGTMAVIVERDPRGKIEDVTVFDEAGNMVR